MATGGTVGAVRVWDGKEWERHCMAILRLHHGAQDFHIVPDRHGGDLGLEAFTQDGCAYQCYAALEPLSTADLYENQRDKLTKDLGKFRNNISEISRLVGSIKVRRYMFMVHRHDSYKIVQHAQSKAEEVKSWNLPFIAHDFNVVVITDDAFPKERSSLLGIPPPLISMEFPEVPTGDWAIENTALVATATRKLSFLSSGEMVRRWMETLMKQYLQAENVLETMRLKYPDQWQATERCRFQKEDLLVLEYGAFFDNPSTGQVTKIVEDLTQDLQRSVPALGIEMAKKFAWASVADWLMRCPLDFIPAEVAA